VIYGILLALHLIVCIVLVLAVLLQAGKGGGLAGAFGSMGMGGMGQSLFGGRGAATFLSKTTTVLGIAFMVTSLCLALLSGTRSPRSVLRDGGVITESEAPPANPVPLEMPAEGMAPGEAPSQDAPGSEPAPAPESPPPGN
jgi:preprotein translocase subunit SecG